MSEPPNRYKITLRDLRERCPLLDSIYVDEALVGKKGDEIVIRARGKITPALVKKFRNSYQTAVAAGIIKRFTPIEQEPT